MAFTGPEGHLDSSNLYAFCAGDPVNGRDPTGRVIVIPPQVFADVWSEVQAAAKNVAIGARNRAVQIVNLVYNAGSVDVQMGLHDQIQETIEVAQDPGYGSSPDVRLLRHKGDQIRADLERFGNVPKGVQQQVINGVALDTVLVLAPSAKGIAARPVEMPTPIPMWEDHLPAARQRAPDTRAGMGASDVVAGGLVGIAQPNLTVLIIKRSQLPMITANMGVA